MSVVVSDTSPIRVLDHLQLAQLLQQLFQSVYAPPAVVTELERAGCIGRVRTLLTIQAPTDTRLVTELRVTVDPGEAEAIALALELRPEYLLADDLAARGEAERRGLNVMGVLGVLVRAKAAGKIPAVMPLVDRMQQEISFNVSPELRRRVRKLAGE